jgi:lipid-A-disaccharide synthase
LYYVPPGSWRRELKASPLAHLADVVATPFPWSETELRKFGVNAYFVGHPLLDSVRPSQSPEAFAQKWGLDKERPLVGILPGSRAGEIAHVLPVQLAAASIIHRRVPSAQFLVGVAPTVDRQTIVRAVEREQAKTGEAHQAVLPQGSGTLGTIAVPVEGGTGARAEDLAKRQQEWIRRAAELPNPSGPFPIAVVENATYDVIAASDVLLITSGTATLEAAILGKPMVIAYKMASVNQIEYHFVRQRLPRFIGMPNLLANKRICPEFIQEAVTPDALANEIIGLLLEPERMLQMRTDLREAVSLLGQPGGAARTAEMVIALANGETLARQTSTHGEHTPPANSSEG